MAADSFLWSTNVVAVTVAVSSRANKQLYSTWIYKDRFRKNFEILKYLFFLCLSLSLSRIFSRLFYG